MTSFLEAVTAEIGRPYVYGGDTPAVGFDCSGLVAWAAGVAGIDGIPHGSVAQFAATSPTAMPTPGDLVFFDNGDGGPQPGHVGIVANVGGSTMIDAPHTGALVRMEGVAGFGPIMGYGRLPGTPEQIAGTGSPTEATLTGIDLGPLGSVPNPLDALGDPFSALGDVAGSVVKPVTDLLAQLPATFLGVLFGDHSLGEIVIRSLETVAGALLIAGGGIIVLRIIAEAGEPARVAGSLERTNRDVQRAARSTKRSARKIAGASSRSNAAARRTRETVTAKPGPRRPARPQVVERRSAPARAAVRPRNAGGYIDARSTVRSTARRGVRALPRPS